MPHSYRTVRSTFGLWASTIEANTAMWTTLAVRVPTIVTGTMTKAEQSRMVAEKLEAWSESANATTASVGQMMIDPKAAFRSPAATAATLLSLSRAAADPFHRRVKANARRLKKRKV